MVGARPDCVKSLSTRPCRPNSERDLVRRPGRDTTQGPRSRVEFMWQAGYAIAYQTKISSGAVPVALLAVDLKLLQGIPCRLHQLRGGIGDRGVVQT